MVGELRTTNKVTAYRIHDLVLLPNSEQMGEEFKGKALILNNVAAFLWNLLQAGITREEMINSLLANFDIKMKVETKELRETVKKEVNYFCETLLYLDLIEEVPNKEIPLEKMKKSFLDVSGEKSQLEVFRKPKIYVYDLETNEEAAFGPHIRGEQKIHRAISRSFQSQCC